MPWDEDNDAVDAGYAMMEALDADYETHHSGKNDARGADRPFVTCMSIDEAAFQTSQIQS